MINPIKITDIKVTVFEHRVNDVVYDREGHTRYEAGNVAKRSLTYIQIETNEGIVGECFGNGGMTEAIQIKSVIEPMLIGENPLDREKIWQKMWYRGRRLDHKYLGGIDVALWDIAGKNAGLPIYRLIGGFRDRIPAYASSAWTDDYEDGLCSPESFADFAENCWKKGYTAFKIHPHPDPAKDIELCQEVSERVGDKVKLMLDPISSYNYQEAVRVGRAIQEMGFYWLEDPLINHGYNIQACQKLTQELDINICGGECLMGSCYLSSEVLARNAVDMIRADVYLKGGITGLLKIARLAESFGVNCEIHAALNSLMNLANLHVACAISNCEYYELGLLHPVADMGYQMGLRKEFEKIDEEGYIHISEKPGLGTEIDYDYIDNNTIKQVGGEDLVGVF